MFASDEAQHSLGSQTDPLGLVQTSKQKIWMTGTSAENTRVATFGSNRGACQLATGTSPTGRGCGPWKSAWSAEHGGHYNCNNLTRVAVWELPTVSRPSAPLPAMHDRDAAAREIVDCAATRVTLGNGYFDHFNMPRSLELMNTEWANRYGKGKKCTSRPKNEIQVGDRIG